MVNNTTIEQTRGQRISGHFTNNSNHLVGIPLILTAMIDNAIADETRELVEALLAWKKVESEMKEDTPVPDLALRSAYRHQAIKLTNKALAKHGASQ
jgi:hypothetical protein